MCAAPGSKTAQLIEFLHKDEEKIPGFIFNVVFICTCMLNLIIYANKIIVFLL